MNIPLRDRFQGKDLKDLKDLPYYPTLRDLVGFRRIFSTPFGGCVIINGTLFRAPNGKTLIVGSLCGSYLVGVSRYLCRYVHMYLPRHIPRLVQNRDSSSLTVLYRDPAPSTGLVVGRALVYYSSITRASHATVRRQRVQA